MSRFNQYWTLLKLTGSGKGKPQTLPPVKALIQGLNPGVTDTDKVPNDRQLQRQLFKQANGNFNAPAMLALRCYISHQILAICRDLVTKFGENYLFKLEEILPFVLNDEGKPIQGSYQPISHKILTTFNPERANLSTWTNRLVTSDDDLNAYLAQQGLRLISDWALLNTATHGKINRLLPGADHLDQTIVLLDAYHEVYRQARLIKGDRGPCKVPSPQQCQIISDRLTTHSISLSADQVMDELLALAKLIRDDDIATKRGAPRSKSLDIPEQQAQLEALASETEPEVEDEIPWEQLSKLYQAELSACLHSAAKDVITQRHQRLKPKKAAIYPRAMTLFYCEGWKMTEIAPHLGINDQSGVTRLLELKRLRAGLRHHAINCLQSQLGELFSPHMSPAQLAALDQRLDENLGPQLDQLIKDEKDQTQTPRQHVTERSTLTQIICEVLQELYPAP